MRTLGVASHVLEMVLRPFLLVLGSDLLLALGDLMAVDAELTDLSAVEDRGGGGDGRGGAASDSGPPRARVSPSPSLPSPVVGDADADDLLASPSLGSGDASGTGAAVDSGAPYVALDDESPTLSKFGSSPAGSGDARDSEGATDERRRAALAQARRRRLRRGRCTKCARSGSQIVAWIVAMILVMVGVARFGRYVASWHDVTSHGVPVLLPPANATTVDAAAALDSVPRAAENVWLMLVGGCFLARAKWPWLAFWQLAAFVGLGWATRDVDSVGAFVAAAADVAINLSVVLAMRHVAVNAAKQRGQWKGRGARRS